jgi:vesicle coat complex subunit
MEIECLHALGLPCFCYFDCCVFFWKFFAWTTSSDVCLSRWGQVFILDALSRYKAADAREAENIVERVTPRLQHANCAVVLSAVKVTSCHCWCSLHVFLL